VAHNGAVAQKKASGRYTPPKARPKSETTWFRITSDDEDFLDLERIPVALLQTVVPIVLRYADGSVKGAGTAFCVARLTTGHALFATARHVVETLESDRKAEPLVLLPPPNLSRVDRDGFFGLHVGFVTMMESHSDVAMLAAALDGTTAPPQVLPLAFGRPQLHELCLGIGFTRMVMGEVVGPDKHLWNYKLHTSRGPVEDLHPDGRDQRLSFPSILVGARFDGGMSGGRILDVHGRAMAVISSGMDAGEGVRPTSYGALAATLAELRIRLADAEGREQEFDFGDLWIGGLLSGDRAGVHLSRVDGRLRVRWP
jgi:hypothetical protein